MAEDLVKTVFLTILVTVNLCTMEKIVKTVSIIEYRVNATQFVQVLHLGLRRLDTMRISFIPRNRVGHNDTNIKYLSCTLQKKYEITGMNKEELPKG